MIPLVVIVVIIAAVYYYFAKMKKPVYRVRMDDVITGRSQFLKDVDTIGNTFDRTPSDTEAIIFKDTDTAKRYLSIIPEDVPVAIEEKKMNRWNEIWSR